MGREHDADLDFDDTGCLPALRDGSDFDGLPDVRDGLTRLERVILHVLNEAKAEFGERHVPTALLYGRVVEYIDVGAQEFQRALSRLAGR